MVVENIPKSMAELYKLLLMELKPDWKVDIIVEDTNLYKLGFVDEILCSLSLDISKKQLNALHDELIDMETEVFLYEDLLYKSSMLLTEEERKLQREIKRHERKYNKFAPLEGLCNYCIKNA